MRHDRRRGGRGQSLIETAMIMPLIILVALGGTDLAVAYGYASDSAGAARAGMRYGIQGEGYDIGDSLRSEPNSVILNNSANWGATAQGGTDGNCTGVGAGVCGDPAGCVAASFVSGQVACFAIRKCTLDTTTYRCASSGFGAWGTRPAATSGLGLEVVVVYKFAPRTPAIAQLTGNNGAFYLTAISEGLELY